MGAYGDNMPEFHLDELDCKILKVLQEAGRTSNQDLAESVGLSPSPCLRRLRQLEASKIITGYAALVDPTRIGLGVTAFVRVRLHQQDDMHLKEFEATIARYPEVMECYLMTGDSDYQLRVLVANLAAFEEFMRHKLTKISGVSQLTTSFALRPVIYKTAVPVSFSG
jgi:Lrp/AsnC family leucine-responsive transcriptional regulator